MTLNDLYIDDRVVNRFLTNCRAHIQAGKSYPAHQARGLFFADLRNEYSVTQDIMPNLPALQRQLDAWEIEAQAEEIT